MPVALPYRLVVFDFDGTLADSGEWFAGALNGVARRFRFRQVTRAELEELRGELPLDMLGHLGVARWKLPLIARHMRGLMARDIAAIARFPGAEHCLATLSDAGVSLAVVSSNAERNVRAVLGPALCQRISHFACGTSLFGKPAKLRKLVARCGVAPDAVLAVGDEIRDIDAARAAGIDSGAVTWGYGCGDALREHGPTLVFATFDEIADAVLPPGAV